MTAKSTITCAICKAEVHSIELHLTKVGHPMTLAEYQTTYPGQPVLSAVAQQRVDAALAEQAKTVVAPAAAPAAPVLVPTHEPAPVLTMHHAALKQVPAKQGSAKFSKVFGIPFEPGMNTGRGTEMEFTVSAPGGEFTDMVPKRRETHVWNIEDVKNMMMAIELNYPLYVHGHKGTGKTQDIMQICAATGRSMIRVQHTINTEESHILGQHLLINGQTQFELGPLPLAMKYGHVYLADEYDFALASTLSVYQPVLEGEPLYIKEADMANRVIVPHPNFRFVATGNTNGTGDDTGLYQGTSVQNSANYDRFAIVIEKDYMPPEKEQSIIEKTTGLGPKEAKKIIEFATEIRKAFGASKLSDTISTRALLAIASVGVRRGSYQLGVKLCFSNKQNRVDRVVVDGVAQRMWGSGAAAPKAAGK